MDNFGLLSSFPFQNVLLPCSPLMYSALMMASLYGCRCFMCKKNGLKRSIESCDSASDDSVSSKCRRLSHEAGALCPLNNANSGRKCAGTQTLFSSFVPMPNFYHQHQPPADACNHDNVASTEEEPRFILDLDRHMARSTQLHSSTLHPGLRTTPPFESDTNNAPLNLTLPSSSKSSQRSVSQNVQCGGQWPLSMDQPAWKLDEREFTRSTVLAPDFTRHGSDAGPAVPEFSRHGSGTSSTAPGFTRHSAGNGTTVPDFARHANALGITAPDFGRLGNVVGITAQDFARHGTGTGVTPADFSKSSTSASKPQQHKIWSLTQDTKANSNTKVPANCPRKVSSVLTVDSDRDIEEHFQRSLGRDYNKCIAPKNRHNIVNSTSAPARLNSTGQVPSTNPPEVNKVNVTVSGAVDDHFAKSLGQKWTEIKSQKSNQTESKSQKSSQTDFKSPQPGSVDDHFAKALGETWFQLRVKKEGT